jgi:hypothetical protein
MRSSVVYLPELCWVLRLHGVATLRRRLLQPLRRKQVAHIDPQRPRAVDERPQRWVLNRAPVKREVRCSRDAGGRTQLPLRRPALDALLRQRSRDLCPLQPRARGGHRAASYSGWKTRRSRKTGSGVAVHCLVAPPDTLARTGS